MTIKFPIAVLKTVWNRQDDGQWAISGVKELKLSSLEGNTEDRYFVVGGDIELLTDSPNRSVHNVMTMFGTPEFLMQQSIVPVVTWLDGERSIRCVGTASIISCTGYVLTAAHVVMDPLESGYGAVREGSAVKHRDDLNFGVLIPSWTPISPTSFGRSFIFFPFEKMWNWGSWRRSPLLHEEERWEHLTDIAVCKIPEMPNGGAHQPLNLSLNPFEAGEEAYAMGYAEMPDIQLNPLNGGLADRNVRLELYVSIGQVISTFPQNHVRREVSTPGPCFDFDARVPGKMSGAPVFGARGVVIRGVVSRSFSGEDHAYGSMLSPAMELGLSEPGITNRSLRSLLKSGTEGMAKVMGTGL